MGLVSAETLKWFDELDVQLADYSAKQKQVYSKHGFDPEAAQWLTSARAAIASVFPAGHTVLKDWEKEASPNGSSVRDLGQQWNHCKGIFASAILLLRQGRLERELDRVRALAEIDVLTIAEELLPKHLIAATVMAGGALEVHLRRLCERTRTLPPGDGSIAKYSGAIAQAQNDGLISPPLFEKADVSQITSWGQLRNVAAHTPDKFQRSETEVTQMISGIRAFFARTP